MKSPFTHFPLWYRVDESREASAARANALRALNLSKGLDVLEIGSGHGITTAYLAGFSKTLTVLNSDTNAAELTRSRVSELANVEHLFGPLPTAESHSYDLILHLGTYDSNLGDVSRYLTALRQLLRPGGRLVLGAANRLGVRFLAGAPGAVSQQPFADIEARVGGSLTPEQVRTALIDAGFTDVQSLAAFPDHVAPRVVADIERIPDSARDILLNVPSFPSPDEEHGATRIADEGQLWRSIVHEGVAKNFANSNIFVAGTGDNSSSPWPAQQIMHYFSNGRRPEFSTQTRVVVRDGSVSFERRSDGHKTVDSRFFVADSDESFSPGTSLIDYAANNGIEASADALKQWQALVGSHPQDAPLPLDLVPHNLLLLDDGSVRAVDQEWFTTAYSPEELLKRGVLLFGQKTAAALTQIVGQNVVAPHDIINQAAAIVGLPEPSIWLDDVIRTEAELYDVISEDDGRSSEERVQAFDLSIRNSLTNLRYGSTALEGASESDRDAWFRAPTSNIYGLRLHLAESARTNSSLVAQLQAHESLIAEQQAHIENQDARISRLNDMAQELRKWNIKSLARKVGRPFKRVLRKLQRR